MKPCRNSRARQWLAQGFECAYRRIADFVSRRKLASTAIAACIGTSVQLYAGLKASVLVWLLAACMLTFLSVRRRKVLMSAVLLLTVSVLFSMYTCIRNERPVFEVRKKAEITGVVSSKPKEQPDKSRTTLMLDDITIDGREMRFSVNSAIA